MAVCLLYLFLSIPVSADDKQILIIKGSENPFFNTSVESLINKTEGAVKFNITTLESIKQNNVLNYEPDIVVTLGYPAAEYTLQLADHIPVIHSYLTKYHYNIHENRRNHYSVLLEQPLQRQIKFVQLLLSTNKIGILTSQENRITANTIKSIKKSIGVNLDNQLLKPQDNTVSAVRNILQNNDVLLSIPDPKVYNRQSLKGILLASYRMNKPVISYSPSHVKSGALAALYTSPENIGEQVATLVNKLIKNKNSNLRKFYYANKFNIEINRNVSDSLQLELPEIDDLLERLEKDHQS